VFELRKCKVEGREVGLETIFLRLKKKQIDLKEFPHPMRAWREAPV